MLERLSRAWRVVRTGSAFAFFFGGGALLAGALPVARRLAGDPDGLRPARPARDRAAATGSSSATWRRAGLARVRFEGAERLRGPGSLRRGREPPDPHRHAAARAPHAPGRLHREPRLGGQPAAARRDRRGQLRAQRRRRRGHRGGRAAHPPGAPGADLPGRHANPPRCHPRSPAPGRRPHRAAGRRRPHARRDHLLAAHADEGAALARRARAGLRPHGAGAGTALAEAGAGGGRDGRPSRPGS